MKKKTLTEIIVIAAAAAVVFGPTLMRIVKERLRVRNLRLKTPVPNGREGEGNVRKTIYAF
jgi:hypothetical protein